MKIETLPIGLYGENSYILHDGVHPTPAGHQLITNALYEVLTPIL